MQERCVSIANLMVDNNLTVRQAAEQFGVSKTTVHDDITKKLKSKNSELYGKVRKLLDEHWKDRARRGGIACATKHPDLLKRLRTNKVKSEV